MGSDENELQEILKKTPAPAPKAGESIFSSLATLSYMGEETPAPADKEEKKASSDYCQWAVYPNGIFQASGQTETHLPVGAYTLFVGNSGLFFVAKKMMTDTLVDLGNSNSLRVINGIKLFWKKKQQFLDRGVLYKRGILLWGPPGSGKTATLTILIQDLINQGGIVILVQNPASAVLALEQLRKIEPDRPLIIVLEDVEEIIKMHGEHDLLALLDGEHQTNNVVNIASTNYPEQLGARIVNRPSRFDEVIKIGMPSDQMRQTYFEHLLKNEKETYPIKAWVKDTKDMSIAHLKELVIAVTCLEQPYAEVISRLKTMKSTPSSSIFDNAVGFLEQK